MIELENPPASERATYLRAYLAALASTLIDRALAQASAPSTVSSSVGEKLLLATLRPLVPQLRNLLLARLSEADPAGLERLLGATSTAIEGVLYHAPGEPEPRFRFDWTGQGVELVADEERDGSRAPA